MRPRDRPRFPGSDPLIRPRSQESVWPRRGAFQVNENYRRLVTARLGIDRARPAVEQARENYRLVRARAVEGDATPSEITDAQTALTRAEQNHLNSIYDYLSAIARLEYVMGVSPSPTNEVAPGP